MKNLIIIIGTIMLGVIIVNTMILGESDSSLKGAAESLVQRGVQTVAALSGDAAEGGA